MNLYRVAITQAPSALEAQAGTTDKLVLSTVEVLANSDFHAIAQAAFNNHEALGQVNLARCTVLAVKCSFAQGNS